MPKFFTLAQAEKLLPEVETALREAMARKTEFEQAEAEWQNSSRRIMVMGGVQIDRAQLAKQKGLRDSAAAEVKTSLERVHGFGCLVKDLAIGLIDFPTLLNCEEVYLCWKLGESGIRFWHGVHEGFRGRKPIDAEFRQQHRGELPN
jgi:hypothetical protein